MARFDRNIPPFEATLSMAWVDVSDGKISMTLVDKKDLDNYHKRRGNVVEYNVFPSSIPRLILNAVKGDITGKWEVVKHGAHFAIDLVRENR